MHYYSQLQSLSQAFRVWPLLDELPGIMFFPLSQFQQGGQWLLEPMPENALRKALLHTRSVFCIVCSGPVYMVYGVLHNIPLSSIQYIRQNVRLIV